MDPPMLVHPFGGKCRILLGVVLLRYSQGSLPYQVRQVSFFSAVSLNKSNLALRSVTTNSVPREDRDSVGFVSYFLQV